MWDKRDERVKDENMQGISFLRSCLRRVIISERYPSGSAFMHVGGWGRGHGMNGKGCTGSPHEANEF